MANVIIVSPSLTTTGGNSGDLFVFRSGALAGATLEGGSGNDTVELLEVPAASANGQLLDTNGGADLFTLSAQVFSGKIRGGAGGDTVTLTGANTINDLALGDGSDVVELSGALTVATNGTIAAGAGADIISGNAVNVLSGSTFLMGAGKDTITFSGSFGSGQINMGGGDDVVNFGTQDSFGFGTIKAGGGNDTIDVSDNLTAGTINLGDGADNLTLSALTISQTGGSYLGGGGADIISGNTDVYLNISGTTIGGGAGADTITVAEFASAGQGGLLAGGGGNDSITLNANAGGAFLGTAAASGEFSAGEGYGTILGGAGSDSITFDGLVNVQGGAMGSAGRGYAGVLAFSALSDSTQGSMDVVTYSGTAGMTKMFLMDFDSTLATGIAASNSIGGISTNAAGFLISAGSNSSVSELISAVDRLTVTGEIATFLDASGDAYVFVQGGSTDFVAEFDNSKADISAGAVVLSKEADGEFRLQLGIDNN
jgi:hypothetical protein